MNTILVHGKEKVKVGMTSRHHPYNPTAGSVALQRCVGTHPNSESGTKNKIRNMESWILECCLEYHAFLKNVEKLRKEEAKEMTASKDSLFETDLALRKICLILHYSLIKPREQLNKLRVEQGLPVERNWMDDNVEFLRSPLWHDEKYRQINDNEMEDASLRDPTSMETFRVFQELDISMDYIDQNDEIETHSNHNTLLASVSATSTPVQALIGLTQLSSTFTSNGNYNPEYSDITDDEEDSPIPGLRDSDPFYSETSPFALAVQLENEQNRGLQLATQNEGSMPMDIDPVANESQSSTPLPPNEEEGAEVVPVPKGPNFFDKIGMSHLLQNGFLARKGRLITEPRPFQKEGLIAMKEGKDVIVEFPATCGKTLMALIGLLRGLSTNGEEKYPEALIFTSTTKIAKKLKKDIDTISSFIPTERPYCMTLHKQKKIRDAGVLANILIGTPEEFMKLKNSPTTGFSKKFEGGRVKTVVIDRLDEMLESTTKIITKIYFTFHSTTQLVVLGRALNFKAMDFAKRHTRNAIILKEINEAPEVKVGAKPFQLADYLTPPSSQSGNSIGLPDYSTPPQSQVEVDQASLPESSGSFRNQVVPRSWVSDSGSTASSDYWVEVRGENVDSEKVAKLSTLKSTILSAPLVYIFCSGKVHWLQHNLGSLGIGPCTIFNPQNPVPVGPGIVLIDQAETTPAVLSILPKASLIVNFDHPEDKNAHLAREDLVDLDGGMVTFGTQNEYENFWDVTTA